MSTFDDFVKKMRESTSNAGECIELLQTALAQNSTAPLQVCREKAAQINKTEADLTARITRLAQENNALRVYLSVPLILQRIAGHIDNLTDTFHKKIKDDILFSDRAISELMILFRRLKEALKNTSDLLVTKNPVLVKHINECEEDIVRKALEFATLHEERLIEGLCLPVSSPLYLNILNSIRCIAWDTNEIASKFSQSE